MNLGYLYRVSDQTCLVPRVWKAVTPRERMRGLLGRPALLPDEGLWIDACRLVHTVGMSYALDLVFLDAQGRVLRLVPELAPVRCAGAWTASSTVELPSGALLRLPLQVGDQLAWKQRTP